MTILQIITIFVIFCVVWIFTNTVNSIIAAKIQQEQQRRRIDDAFGQIARLVLRARAEAAARRRAADD